MENSQLKNSHRSSEIFDLVRILVKVPKEKNENFWVGVARGKNCMFQAGGFELSPYWGAMSRNRQFACLNGPRIVQNVVRNLPAKTLKNDFLWHHMGPQL